MLADRGNSRQTAGPGPVRFAIVGDVAAVVLTLKAIAVDAGHELVAVVPISREAGGVPELPLNVRRCRSWEELLADPATQGAIVADDADESLVAARQFAAAGKALLLAPLVARAAPFVYELGLLRAERPVPLVPLYALRNHPLLRKLKHLLQSGGLGAIQHMQLEVRLVPRPPAGGQSSLSMDDLASAFLEDLDLLRLLGGEFDQVTAIRSGDPATGISLQSITLSGAGLPQAIWSATPGIEPAWKLQVVGDQGTARLEGETRLGRLSLEIPEPGGAPLVERADFDSAAWCGVIARASETPAATPSRALGEGRAPLATWDDFTRAAELFEAVERSLRRRRTIEIHFESHSERGQFKTHMTAVGCSLLTLTFFAVVAYLTAASLIELPAVLKKVLVALIFLPLGLFLVLQGLIFLARPSNDSTPAGPE